MHWGPGSAEGDELETLWDEADFGGDAPGDPIRLGHESISCLTKRVISLHGVGLLGESQDPCQSITETSTLSLVPANPSASGCLVEAGCKMTQAGMRLRMGKERGPRNETEILELP